MFNWWRRFWKTRKPLQHAVVHDNQVTNAEDILGEWREYTPYDGGHRRQIRTGWCYVNREDEMNMLHPDSFSVVQVWGPVEIRQIRIERNEQFHYSPVMIHNTNAAYLRESWFEDMTEEQRQGLKHAGTGK
jgi:hypothetical protein